MCSLSKLARIFTELLILYERLDRGTKLKAPKSKYPDLKLENISPMRLIERSECSLYKHISSNLNFPFCLCQIGRHLSFYHCNVFVILFHQSVLLHCIHLLFSRSVCTQSISKRQCTVKIKYFNKPGTTS